MKAKPKAVVRAIGAAILLSACSGDLDDPERFDENGSSSMNGASNGSGAGSGGDCPDIPALFEMRCASAPCHDDDEPQAGLSLATNPDGHLVGVESSKCSGRLRVDPADPEASVLLEVLQPNPSCAQQMPPEGLGERLDAAEIACVRAWITETAGGQ